MKTFRSIVAAFFFAAIFAVSAFAQTAAPTGKIGIINTSDFDAKEGITKYVNAMNTLETQMKPEMTALQTMNTRMETLKVELQKLQDQLNDPKLPAAVDKVKLQADGQKKLEELQKLGLEFEYKQKESKANLERREVTIMNPVRVDIGNALQEYAKKNGYMLILDASKMANSGLILALDEKSDITKDFITFYNARPATTAAVK